MVKLSADGGLVAMNSTTKKAVVNLFADVKADVTDGMEIVGMPDGYEIDTESTVITAKGELAFRKSDGTWNWV